MKRRLLYYGLAVVAVGTTLWACQKEGLGGGSPDRPEPTLTVSEARDFFEYQFSQAAPYLSKVAGDKPVGMMPGDFTPLWDKARIGANSEMDGADVPIDPKFIFTAIYNRVSASGDTVREMVDVAQKLVVKKWRNTEEYEAFCYIASVVPTPEHYAKHRHSAAREFCYGGDKGRFSGFVMYRSLDGVLVAIDNYRDGRLTRHDYFPRITEQNRDSVQRVALLTTGDLTLQAGTPAAFRLGTEEDPWCADEITVCAQGVCTICHKNPCECSGGKRDDPDVTWPDPKDDTGGGSSGGGGGNTGSTDGDGFSVTSLFNASNLSTAEIAEFNAILSNLAKLGMSRNVLQQLMAKGKINLVKGVVTGHEKSYGVYDYGTNTITINTGIATGNNLRNAIMEETFHAFQRSIYGAAFDQRCYEFEAKVYGTIIINLYGPQTPGFISYLSPMNKETSRSIQDAFGIDIKRMTGDFTHGISPAEMNMLYDDYGRYCTQYTTSDPDWDFQAIRRIGFGSDEHPF